MVRKFGKIFIGIMIGLIFIGTVWYLVQGWSDTPVVEEQISLIKEDLLSNQAIDMVKSKTSLIKFPINVSKNKMGIAKPFN